MSERYIVTFYDEKASVRRFFASTNDLWEARRWVDQIDRAAFPQLTDRVSREKRLTAD